MAIAAAVLALTASGCAADDDVLPDGVVVDLYQTRLDVAERTIEISVANTSGAEIRILEATLTSDQFAAPATWDAREGGTLVPAGFTVDLPVAVPAAACGSDDPVHRVTLEFETAAGERATTDVEVVERFDQLVQLRAQDCLAASVAAVATLTLAQEPTVQEHAGTRMIALPLTVAPTGSEGSVLVRSIASTVLLTFADPETGTPTDIVVLDRTVLGTDQSSTIALLMLPARCDPHVVTEDKVGTVFEIAVSAPDGATGTMLVRADDAVKAAIYVAVAELCGFPAP